jgi:CheY-like chemotaxis protein
MLTNHMTDVDGRSKRAGRIKGKNQRPPRDGRGKTRILVVEDEIFVAWHLESVLRDLDYAVCGLVPDGATAVEKADQLAADLVLMDINLKGDIDGVEAARRIRAHAAAPIIFITAYSDAHTLARIQNAVPGAPVLAKPVAPQRLRSAIEQVLESRH